MEKLRRALANPDVRDGLVLAVVVCVVWPLAPDRQIGPLGGLNPASLVRLVVIVTLVAAGGALAQRFLGPRFGLVAAGFAAGFVSSSATIAAMGLRSKDDPTRGNASVAAALASSVATVVEYGVLVGAVDSALLVEMLPSLSLGLLAALIGTVLALARDSSNGGEAIPKGRVFQVRAAAGFAALYVGITMLTRFIANHLGVAGVLGVSALGGFVDAHSTAGSIATLTLAKQLTTATGELALVSALTSNTVTKVVVAWTTGTRAFAARTTIGVLGIAAAAWVGVVAA
ncbi:MAG: DUF4010 domain-containing protein [Deltaproteobacteria bacterium]|nr:DUF4010 domain-containing protein [Deltaproteobacteria bacterium]